MVNLERSCHLCFGHNEEAYWTDRLSGVAAPDLEMSNWPQKAKGPTKAGPQIKVGTPVTALIVFLSYLTFCL